MKFQAQLLIANIDGAANEYTKFPADTKSSIECTNACLRDPRCLLAVKDSKFCYLKDFPANPGTCADNNGCWVLKGFGF